MVQFLASDAHRVKSYELMERALDRAEEIVGRKKFEQIMNLNPAIVLGNRGTIQCSPIEYSPKKKHHFFPSFKKSGKKRLGGVGIQ